jgi:hypothetical protein
MTSLDVALIIAAARVVEVGGGDLRDADLLLERWRAAGRRGALLAASIRERAQTVRCACATPAPAAPDGRCSRCWGWPPGVPPVARPAPAPTRAETGGPPRLPPLRPAPRTPAETWRALRSGYDWRAISASRQREAA